MLLSRTSLAKASIAGSASMMVGRKAVLSGGLPAAPSTRMRSLSHAPYTMPRALLMQPTRGNWCMPAVDSPCSTHWMCVLLYHMCPCPLPLLSFPAGDGRFGYVEVNKPMSSTSRAGSETASQAPAQPEPPLTPFTMQAVRDPSQANWANASALTRLVTLATVCNKAKFSVDNSKPAAEKPEGATVVEVPTFQVRCLLHDLQWPATALDSCCSAAQQAAQQGTGAPACQPASPHLRQQRTCVVLSPRNPTMNGIS
jgi:hypothetical protein